MESNAQRRQAHIYTEQLTMYTNANDAMNSKRWRRNYKRNFLEILITKESRFWVRWIFCVLFHSPYCRCTQCQHFRNGSKSTFIEKQKMNFINGKTKIKNNDVIGCMLSFQTICTHCSYHLLCVSLEIKNTDCGCAHFVWWHRKCDELETVIFCKLVIFRVWSNFVCVCVCVMNVVYSVTHSV